MEKVLVTIAVPAAQLDAANVAMVQATGNGADGSAEKHQPEGL